MFGSLRLAVTSPSAAYLRAPERRVRYNIRRMRAPPPHPDSACAPARARGARRRRLRAGRGLREAAARQISRRPTAAAAAIPVAGAHVGRAAASDWPEFGLDPQRSDVSEARHRHHQRQRRPPAARWTCTLPGTVDSSPIYLHGVIVAGATHNVVVVTTTYGKTLAIDADSGKILWTFTPPGYAGWAGSAQITTASPLADPDGQFVYAASPERPDPQAARSPTAARIPPALAGERHARRRRTRSSARRSTSTGPTWSPRPAATSATSPPTRATSS